MDGNEKLLELFDQALDFSSVEERGRFLDQTCDGDLELRHHVEVLLHAHHNAGNFLRAEGRPGGGLWPSAEDLDTERPGDRIGHYRIVAPLGEGGFSTVHLARQDAPLRRWVALKVLKPGMDTRQVVARFEMERQALATMEHSGIAKVFDAGSTPGGRPYFAMEYVPGTKITQFADRVCASVPERLRLMCQVCEAVLHAHRKGIIHRDIKPSNIMAARCGKAPVCKVIDFGIARSTRPLMRDATPFTRGGRFLGTPAYMSPEQARMTGPAELDTRADIYSLGAVLYELLTGCPPFDHEMLMRAGVAGMAEIICRQEPLRPSARLRQMSEGDREAVAAARGMTGANLASRLTGDLDWITLKALEKDRDLRYATAASLAEDIRRHLEQRPVIAAAPTLSYRLTKFVSRNRMAVAAGSGIAALLLASTAISALMAFRAQTSRIHSERHQLIATTAAQQAKTSVVDLHVAAGLSASSRGDFAGALLQFAHAADLSDPGSHSREVNRARSRFWTRFAPLPLRALEASPGLSQLDFNPTRPLLLMLARGHACTVWDWRADRKLSWAADAGPTQAATWSADGNLLALVSTAGDVQVRRLPHGETVRAFSLPVPPTALALSPDGRWLATGGDTIRLYALDSGPAEARWEPPAPVTSLLFSPASDRLVTAGADGWARVWDVPSAGATGHRLVASVPHQSSIRSGGCAADTAYKEDTLRQPQESTLAFFDTGEGLITRSGPYEVTCWKVDTGDALRRITGLCCSCNFTLHPDRETLASGARDGHVGVWDLATGQLQFPLLSPGGCVSAVVFGPGENTLLTGGADHTSSLWSLADEPGFTASLRHFDNVVNVAASSRFHVMATAQSDGLVRVWPATTPGPPGRLLAYPRGPKRVRLRGNVVVATTETAWAEHLSQTRLYRVDTGKGVGPTISLDGELQDAALSPDEGTLAVLVHPSGGAGRGTLDFLKPATGRRLRLPTDLPHRPVALSWRPDGSGVAIVCEGGEVALAGRQHTQGVAWLTTETQSDEQVSPQILFTPDGTRLAGMGPDGAVKVWDMDTRQLLYPPLQALGYASWFMALSPDGAHLVTTTREGMVAVWDLETGRLAAPPLVHQTWVYRASFSPDGNRLLTAGHDRQVRLWDWRNGRVIVAPFDHPSEVYDAVFTPDGRWAITACHFGTVRIWDCLQGSPVTPSITVGTQAFNAAVTPDGRHAVFGCLGRAVQVLDLGILFEDDPRSSQDFILLGEVSAGNHVARRQTRVLTSREWMDRFRRLQAVRPSWVDALGPAAETYGRPL